MVHWEQSEFVSKRLLRNPLEIRPRLPLLCAVAAGLTVLLLARPTPGSMAAGMALVATGAFLRLWAAGHLYKTRTLVTSGPYAWIRHPLYTGAFLIVSGFLVAASGIVTRVGLPALALFFFASYLPRKSAKEDARLGRRHARYAEYRAAVPALIPWRGRYGKAARSRWSFGWVRDNDEMGTLALVAAIALLFCIDLGL